MIARDDRPKLTLEGAAQELGLPYHTFRRYIKNGIVPDPEDVLIKKDGDKIYLFLPREVEMARLLIDAFNTGQRHAAQKAAMQLGRFTAADLMSGFDLISSDELAKLFGVTRKQVVKFCDDQAERRYGARLVPMSGGRGKSNKFMFRMDDVIEWCKKVTSPKLKSADAVNPASAPTSD
jgi:hypothetical protein